ncbi:MAG: HEAT repeat domain-containing protein [Polyangiales bacterium]
MGAASRVPFFLLGALILAAYSADAVAQFPLIAEGNPDISQQSPELRGRLAARLRGAQARWRLEHGTPSERMAAAEDLRGTGDPRQAVEALEAALPREANGLVRAAIAESLAFHGNPSSGAVLAESFTASARAGLEAIAHAIGSLREPAGIEALVAGLDRADRIRAAREGIALAGVAAVPLLRRRARESPSVPVLRALGELGDASALPELVAAVSHAVASVRASAIQALGELGDDRARNTVRIATGDADPSVVNVAWEALASLAGPADAEALAAGLERGVHPPLLLKALLRVDAPRGVAQIVSYASGNDPDLALLASSIALEMPRADLVPVLHGLVREGSRREEALSALAEAEDGAGLPVLLEFRTDRDAQRAIAVCLRRWPFGARIRRAGLAALRALPTRGPASARNLVLRALAGDEEVIPLLEARLEDGDASIRAWAATGLGLVGSRSGSAIYEALREEEDIESFRRLVDAARRHHTQIPERAVRRFAAEPHAQAAIFRSFAQGSVGVRERRRLRRALHDGWEPTVRAALDAIVRLEERAAIPTLFAAYDRSEDAARRRFIARALAALGAADSPEALRRRRIAYDPVVRLAWSGGGGAQGQRVLRFRVEAEQAPEGVLCLIELPSGEMRLQRTLAGGELFVPDLQAGSADVRPILERDI